MILSILVTTYSFYTELIEKARKELELISVPSVQQKNLTIKISQNNYPGDVQVGEQYEIIKDFREEGVNFFKGDKFKVLTYDIFIGVEMERKSYNFHTCDSKCKNNHGWFFGKEYSRYFRKI